MSLLSLMTAFLLGLFGGAHCVGMCGGIIGSLSAATQSDSPEKHWLILINYNLGRILSYVLISVVFYLFIKQIADYFLFNFMRVLAGLLLIAMGLYLANWWRGLVHLEKLGGHLWRFLQPLSRSLLPVQYPRQAFLLGMLWGWLPCGLIYSALAYSASADNVIQAGLIMFSFALGTLPAVLATGLLAERIHQLIKQKKLRNIFALMIISFGLWTLWASLMGHH